MNRDHEDGGMIRNDPGHAILGIDPGLDGAVAWIFPGHAEARVAPTLPASKAGRRRFDVAAMVALLKAHPVELAILEAVSAAPVAGRVQGTASMFGFGRGLGIWEGILAALAIPHLAVTPQVWKKAVLADTARRARRGRRVAHCRVGTRRPTRSLAEVGGGAAGSGGTMGGNGPEEGRRPGDGRADSTSPTRGHRDGDRTGVVEWRVAVAPPERPGRGRQRLSDRARAPPPGAGRPA